MIRKMIWVLSDLQNSATAGLKACGSICLCFAGASDASAGSMLCAFSAWASAWVSAWPSACFACFAFLLRRLLGLEPLSGADAAS